jgi:lysophospholipase L1-like esterase
VLIETNSYGFRDKEIPQKKEKNEIRILALGDSITFGDYLNNEDVYVKRIEKYLQEIFPDKKIEVINTGVSDIGITEEIDILKENGLKTKPDLVLVGFYLNDTRPPWGFAQELGSRGWLRKHFLLAEYLYRQIKMRGWVKEKGVIRHVTLNQFEKQLKWKTDPKDFLKIISLTCFDWGAGWAADFRDILHCQLKELSRLSKQHHFKVMIVIFPVSYQIISDSTNDTPQKIVQEETRKFGFYCYDLLPLLRKQKPRQLYFDQCHPNKFANDLIGKAIAGELVEKIKKI